jgi:hypothetical protein
MRHRYRAARPIDTHMYTGTLMHLLHKKNEFSRIGHATCIPRTKSNSTAPLAHTEKCGSTPPAYRQHPNCPSKCNECQTPSSHRPRALTTSLLPPRTRRAGPLHGNVPANSQAIRETTTHYPEVRSGQRHFRSQDHARKLVFHMTTEILFRSTLLLVS